MVAPLLTLQLLCLRPARRPEGERCGTASSSPRGKDENKIVKIAHHISKVQS